MSELFPPRTQKQSNPKQAINETLSIMAAVGWGIPTPTYADNLAAFFARMSYIAHIVVETSIERDLSWQETMEAWLDGR